VSETLFLPDGDTYARQVEQDLFGDAHDHADERAGWPGLAAAWDQVPDGNPVRAQDLFGGSLTTKRVYGNDSQMMVATRSAGYHSKAHTHDCEQLNWVAEGEIWIMVEREGYLLRKGDFMRVPRTVVHWAWNRSDGDCVLVESHAPANVGRQDVREGSAGLFGVGETPHLVDVSETLFLPDGDTYARQVERDLFDAQVGVTAGVS
jgi:mannose-6-phosphate isomerase-like protein (cupin superfamily)